MGERGRIYQFKGIFMNNKNILIYYILFCLFVLVYCFIHFIMTVQTNKELQERVNLYNKYLNSPMFASCETFENKKVVCFRSTINQ